MWSEQGDWEDGKYVKDPEFPRLAKKAANLLGKLTGTKLSQENMVWCFANYYGGPKDDCPHHRDTRSDVGSVVMVLKSPGELPFLVSKAGPADKELDKKWQEKLLGSGSMIAMAESGVTHKFPANDRVSRENPRVTLNFFW